MSHFDHGPLATYNSLTDTHLAGFFANTRKRRHLVKSGLVSRNGVIVSEATYRLNMSRKEHKKYVKDMLAQAIVHKTLDLERTRQAEIKKKLEEIAKIQLVQRVRASRGRKGDEEILPLLTLKAGRPYSSPTSKPRGRSPNSKYRPYSAPGARPDSRFSQTSTEDDGDVLYLDDEGQPITSHRELGSNDHIDTRHLYSLDTAALRKYAMMMSQMEQGRGLSSPYLMPRVPLPPRFPLSGRSLRSARYAKSTSPQRPVTTDGHISRLHHPEGAKMHEGQQESMCKITMKYHGWDLHLAREQMDPTQEIQVEQQHCGGNTLTVFKERLVPGSEFSFISYRHRGYPFSLTLYVDGHVDSRVSTCCEDRHSPGAKIGGKQGHFSIICVDGAVPCYKCQVAKGVMIQNKAPCKQKKRPPESHAEEVIVVSSTKDKSDKSKTAVNRSESPHDNPDEKPVRIAVEKEDDNEQYDKNADKVDKDNYDDDFETSGSSPLSSNRSSSESESEKTPESASSRSQSNQKGRDKQLQVAGNGLCEEAGARLQPETTYEASHSKSRKGCANVETNGPLQCNVKTELSSFSSVDSYSSSVKNHKKSKAQFSGPDKVSYSPSASVKEGRKGNSLSKKDKNDVKADNEKAELITVKTVAPVKEEQDTVEDVSDIESELASPRNEFETVVDPVSDKNPRRNKTCLPRTSSDKEDQEAKWSNQDEKNRWPTHGGDCESEHTSHVGWEANEGKQEMGLKSKQAQGKSSLTKIKTVSFPEDHSQSSSHSSRERNDAFETSSSSSSSLSSSSSSSSSSSRGFNTNHDISVEYSSSSSFSSSSSSSSSAAQDNDESHNSLGGGQSESSKKLEPGKVRISSVKKRPKEKLNNFVDVSKPDNIDMEKSADDPPPLKDDFNGSLLVEDGHSDTAQHHPAISRPDFPGPENTCGKQEVSTVDHDGPEVKRHGGDESGPEDESDQSVHESIVTSSVDEACHNDEEIEKEETVLVVISHEITDDNSQLHSESPLRADAKHKQMMDDVENVDEDEMPRLTRLANSCHDSDGAGSEPVEEGNEPDGAGGEPLVEGSGYDGAGREPVDAGTEPNDEGREPDDAGHKSDGAGSEPDEKSFQSRETEPVFEVLNSEQSRLTPVIRIDCSDEGPELPEREEHDGPFTSGLLFVNRGRDHGDWTPFSPQRGPPYSLAVPSITRDLHVCERWVGEDDLAQLASCKVGPDDEKDNWRCEDSEEESRTKVTECVYGTSDTANSRDGCVKVSEEGVTVSTGAEEIKEEEVYNHVPAASAVETKEVRQIDSDTVQSRDIENVDKDDNSDEDHDSSSSTGEPSRSYRYPISTTTTCGGPQSSDKLLGEDDTVVDNFLEGNGGVVDGADMPSDLDEDGSVVDDVVLPFVEHDDGFVNDVDAPAGVDPPEVVQNKQTVPGGRFSPFLRSRMLRKIGSPFNQEMVKTMISLQDSATSSVLAGPKSSDQYIPDDDNESTTRVSHKFFLGSEESKSYEVSKVDEIERSNINGERIKIIVNDLSENQTKEMESCANKMNKLQKTFKDVVHVLHSDGTKSHMPTNVEIEVKEDVSIDVENKLTIENNEISPLAESMYFEDDGPETLILESRAEHIAQPDLGSHASDLDSEHDTGTNANDLDSEPDLGTNANDLDSEPDLGTHANDLDSQPDLGSHANDLDSQPDLGSHANDLDSEPDLGSHANDLDSEPDLGSHANDLDSEPDLGSHANDLDSGPKSDTSSPT